MRITDLLYGEHGAIYVLMDAVEEGAATADLARLQAAAKLFETTILAHARFEDEPLFAAIEGALPGGGPVAAMRAEHHEIESELARVAASRDLEEARHRLAAAFAAARSHFHKEEVVLFPLAERLLGREVLETMGEGWGRSRGVALPRSTAAAATAATAAIAASAATTATAR